MRKNPDGFADFAAPYRSDPQWLVKLDKWWNRYGLSVLVAALFILGILVWSEITPAKFTQAQVGDMMMVEVNRIINE